MKRLLTLVLAIMVVVSMTSFVAHAEEKEELYFYYADKMDSENMFTAFEEENNVDVIPVHVLAEDWLQYMTVTINGGAQIDVFEINGQDVRSFTQKGLLVDLSDKVDYLDRFHTASYVPFELNDGLYALPFSDGTAMAMFYNKQIFADAGLEIPVTWEDFEHCKEVLNEKGIALMTHCGSITYMWPSWYFMLLSQATDGHAADRTFEILSGESSFLDADSLEAMQVLEKLGTEGYFMSGVNAYDREAAVQAFIDGEAAIYFSGIWDRGSFRAGGMDEDTLGIMNPPLFCEAAIADKIYTTGAASGCSLAIYSGTEKMDLSLKLIEWMTNSQMATDYRFLYQDEKNITGSVYPPYVEFTVPEGYDVDVLDDQIRTLVSETEVWLDWYWPTLITDAFKEMIQAVVGGQIDAESAMQYIQDTYDECVLDGYVF